MMRYEKHLVIRTAKGLHARLAAAVVHQASQINRTYGVTLYMSKLGLQAEIPITSMLSLTSLGIRSGDTAIVFASGEKAEPAVEAMIAYLDEGINTIIESDDAVDEIINASTLTTERVFESLNSGLIVVDEANRISYFNQAAERILKRERGLMIGKNADQVLENSELDRVLKTGVSQENVKQVLGKTTVVSNRSPIVVDNAIRGAVAVFQDISQFEALSSELETTKVLKERLELILQNVHDGVAMVDERGILIYVNSAYERIWRCKREDVVGKAISSLSHHEADKEVLKTGRNQLGVTLESEEKSKLIVNAAPIVLDGKVRGVISTYMEVTDLKIMMERLQMAEDKLAYYEEEMEKEWWSHQSFAQVIGHSAAIEGAIRLANKAARSSATVLIRGESGTGKEVLARAIHAASEKISGPFVGVNCAAIPETLIESELFGHEKGSFTGAIQRKIGKFELADKGTLFLDEIGDLSRDMQVKLLRVLQEKEFERVGGNDTIRVKVRVMAATNRDLEAMMKAGDFREDLYYRLNVIPITMPPLRNRQGDIPLLVEHFLEKVCEMEEMDLKSMSLQALRVLEAYDWPGKIRELENIITRTVAMSEGDLITLEDLPGFLRPAHDVSEGLISLSGGTVATMEAYDRAIIQKALEIYPSYNQAAKALGITHRTVALKAKKYGLDKK
jgi:phosphotransferase system HPr (HPr) family protein